MAYCDDGTMAANHGTKYFCDLIGKAMTQVNRPPITSGVLPERLRAAGFVGIQAFELKQPYGVWAKEERLKLAGRCLLQQADTLFHSYGVCTYTPPFPRCRRASACADETSRHGRIHQDPRNGRRRSRPDLPRGRRGRRRSQHPHLLIAVSSVFAFFLFFFSPPWTRAAADYGKLHRLRP